MPKSHMGVTRKISGTKVWACQIHRRSSSGLLSGLNNRRAIADEAAHVGRYEHTTVKRKGPRGPSAVE